MTGGVLFKMSSMVASLNAAVSLFLDVVPDVVQAAALLVCVFLAGRALMRRGKPSWDWYAEWRGPGFRPVWSVSITRSDWEIWTGRAYLCVSLGSGSNSAAPDHTSRRVDLGA